MFTISVTSSRGMMPIHMNESYAFCPPDWPVTTSRIADGVRTTCGSFFVMTAIVTRMITMIRSVMINARTTAFRLPEAAYVRSWRTTGGIVKAWSINRGWVGYLKRKTQL